MEPPRKIQKPLSDRNQWYCASYCSHLYSMHIRSSEFWEQKARFLFLKLLKNSLIHGLKPQKIGSHLLDLILLPGCAENRLEKFVKMVLDISEVEHLAAPCAVFSSV